jgi:hypothetical protein
LTVVIISSPMTSDGLTGAEFLDSRHLSCLRGSFFRKLA